MKQAARVALLILAILGVVFITGRHEHSLEAIVTAVYDGDTLTVMYIKHTNLPAHIRLYSIDAPEIGDNGAREARDELRYLALGKRVTVRHYNRLTYGRLLAYVEVDGLDLTAAMLRSDLVSILALHPEERRQYRR